MTSKYLPWVQEKAREVGASRCRSRSTHTADSPIFCLSASLLGGVSAIRDGLQHRERLRELKATGLISERQEQGLG